MERTSNSNWHRSSQLLSPLRSLLVVVDVQERLLPSISEKDRLAGSIRFLLDAASILNVRTVLTEQYPKGLGRTVPEIADHCGNVLTLEKLRFSAAEVLQESGELNRPADGMMRQIVVTGIEAHICVQQTALDLMSAGYDVFLPTDAVSSRFQNDCETALGRLQQAGVKLTTAESIAFEWCEKAGSEEFKSLSRLVKERARS